MEMSDTADTMRLRASNEALRGENTKLRARLKARGMTATIGDSDDEARAAVRRIEDWIVELRLARGVAQFIAQEAENRLKGTGA
jgi:alkanesulfonate monooxygenase SsuD/methylene tetrahydromethanopterin reductase-like flavin-dependent oxidoreductase (luciferase family)